MDVKETSGSRNHIHSPQGSKEGKKKIIHSKHITLPARIYYNV